MGRLERQETHRSREKEVARLRHTHDVLYRKYRQSIRWEPLEKPERAGWERNFVLRQDIANSDRADIFTELLGYINTTQYSDDGKFLTTKYEGKWRRGPRNRNRAKVKRVQNVRNLSVREFEKLPEKFHKYFGHLFYHGKHGWRNEWILNNQWMYELKITPHFVTHKRIADEELWEEIEQISNRLWDESSELYSYTQHYKDDWWAEGLERKRRHYEYTILEEGLKELEG